jgi:hypothetical protein
MPPKKAMKDPNETMRKALKAEVDDLMEKGKIDTYAAQGIREKIYDDKFDEVKGMIDRIKNPRVPVVDEAALARQAKMAEIKERMAKAREERLAKQQSKPKATKPKNRTQDIENLLEEINKYNIPEVSPSSDISDIFESIEHKIKGRKSRSSNSGESRDTKILRKIRKHSQAICDMVDKLLR